METSAPIMRDIEAPAPTSAASTTSTTMPSADEHQPPSGERLIEMIKASRTPGTKAPKEALKAVYSAGVYKANLPLDILILQSFMAGIFIGMAGQLFLTCGKIGGGLIGPAFFPVGLIAVILTSAELFTGDALVFVTSFLGGKVTLKQLARNWTVSWIGNFIGCLTWALLISFLNDGLDDKGAGEFAMHVAQKKAFQPWMHIFLKGIGANFMVCMGVWMATCAEEVTGKILAIWFPTTGFVLMSLDHAIANQYLIPVGMMLMHKHPDHEGSEISVYHLFFKALLPATLGNLVGGGILVGAIYWYAFDSMETMNRVRDRVGNAWQARPRYHNHRGSGVNTTAPSRDMTPHQSSHGAVLDGSDDLALKEH